MLMVKGLIVEVNVEDDVFILGGGDGIIKFWNFQFIIGEEGVEIKDYIQEIMIFGQDDVEFVLFLVIDGLFLYVGKFDGVVEFWDFDMVQKLWVIRVYDCNIEFLQMGWGYFWVVFLDGWVSVSDKGSLCWF